MFAFGGKFDQGAVTEVADFDPIWERATARDKCGKVVPGSPKFFAEFAMGSLEATHGRALSLRVVYRRRAVGLLQLGDFESSFTDVLVQGTPFGVG